MKKILLIFMILAFSFAFTSCKTKEVEKITLDSNDSSEKIEPASQFSIEIAESVNLDESINFLFSYGHKAASEDYSVLNPVDHPTISTCIIFNTSNYRIASLEYSQKILFEIPNICYYDKYKFERLNLNIDEVKLLFRQKEILTIPKEFVMYESGLIMIYFGTWYYLEHQFYKEVDNIYEFYKNPKEHYEGGSVKLYYKISNDKIFFSSNEFDNK